MLTMQTVKRCKRCVLIALNVFGLAIVIVYLARNSAAYCFRSRPAGTGYVNEDNSLGGKGDGIKNVTREKNVNSMLQTTNRNLFNYMASYLRETPYPGVCNYANYMVTFLNMTPLENNEPLLPGYQPVINDVRSFEYDTKLKTCVPTNATSFFVLINSAPGNFIKRNTIRQTWYKTLKSDVISKIRGPSGKPLVLAGVGFATGRKSDGSRYDNIKLESEEFGDILEMNMVDTYYNLSVKAAAYLNWIDTRCPDVDFVIKFGDDVFVNVRNLVSFVHQLDVDRVFVYGKHIHGTVQRGNNKWKMTYEQYPWREYPNYFAGPVILIAGKAIRPLIAAAQTIPYHQFDDLYITGFCTERAGVALANTDRLYAGAIVGSALNACYVRNSIAWLLDDVIEIINSHTVAEQYYNNSAQCIPHGSIVPTNPDEYLKFTFEEIPHLRI